MPHTSTVHTSTLHITFGNWDCFFFSLDQNYVFCKEQQCRNDNFGLLFNY